MSQLTRHTSHVTHQTSHLTRHTSHVTRHTSHIISVSVVQHMSRLKNLDVFLDTSPGNLPPPPPPIPPPPPPPPPLPPPPPPTSPSLTLLRSISTHQLHAGSMVWRCSSVQARCVKRNVNLKPVLIFSNPLPWCQPLNFKRALCRKFSSHIWF